MKKIIPLTLLLTALMLSTESSPIKTYDAKAIKTSDCDAGTTEIVLDASINQIEPQVSVFIEESKKSDIESEKPLMQSEEIRSKRVKRQIRCILVRAVKLKLSKRARFRLNLGVGGGLTLKQRKAVGKRLEDIACRTPAEDDDDDAAAAADYYDYYYPDDPPDDYDGGDDDGSDDDGGYAPSSNYGAPPPPANSDPYAAPRPKKAPKPKSAPKPTQPPQPYRRQSPPRSKPKPKPPSRRRYD